MPTLGEDAFPRAEDQQKEGAWEARGTGGHIYFFGGEEGLKWRASGQAGAGQADADAGEVEERGDERGNEERVMDAKRRRRSDSIREAEGLDMPCG